MKEGSDAFVNGETLDDNPYLFNSPNWRRWNRGFGNARMGKALQK